MLFAFFGAKKDGQRKEPEKKQANEGDILGDFGSAGVRAQVGPKLEHPIDAYAPQGVRLNDVQRAQIASLLSLVGVKNA